MCVGRLNARVCGSWEPDARSESDTGLEPDANAFRLICGAELVRIAPCHQPPCVSTRFRPPAPGSVHTACVSRRLRSRDAPHSKLVGQCGAGGIAVGEFFACHGFELNFDLVQGHFNRVDNAAPALAGFVFQP